MNMAVRGGDTLQIVNSVQRSMTGGETVSVHAIP